MTLVFYHSLFYFTKYNYNAFPTQISDCFFIIMNTKIYIDDTERKDINNEKNNYTASLLHIASWL